MLKISSHKQILIKIIREIYSNIELGPVLGFKGGTAVYLLYNLPRFSVDLDFDLLNESKKNIVFDKITIIVKKFGELKEAKEKRFNLLWILSYEKGQKQLKIEISKRNIESGYEVKNYLGLPIQIMKKEDIFANKLTALLERKKLANRDIFDVWFMLNNNWDLNDKLLELRTKMGAKTYLGKCLDLLEKNPPKNILENMGELLDNKTKDWVKKNLIKDTIFLLKASYDL